MSAVQQCKIAIELAEKFNVHYRIYNPRLLQKTPPLVCVHHMTGNCADFEYLANSVSNFAVISVDIVGRGRSDWLSNISLYNYDTYCSIIMQLMQYLQIKKVRLIGSSMGGIIGMFLAARFPDSVTHLVLNDIGPYIEERPLSQILKYLQSYRSLENLEDARKYFKTWLINFGIDQEKHWDHLVINYVMSEEGKYKPAFDPAIGQALKQQVENCGGVMDIWDTWDKIQCKILVLRGELSNVLTRDIMGRMFTSGKAIDVVEFPNVGHVPALYDENRIQDVCWWLRNH